MQVAVHPYSSLSMGKEASNFDDLDAIMADPHVVEKPLEDKDKDKDKEKTRYWPRNKQGASISYLSKKGWYPTFSSTYLQVRGAFCSHK